MGFQNINSIGYKELIPKFDHITPTLMKLHWLPVKHHVLFKILLIVYKALHGLAPKYICDLLTRKQDCCYSLMRSDMQDLLDVPYILAGRHQAIVLL